MTPQVDVTWSSPEWNKLDFDAVALAQEVIPRAFAQADLPAAAKTGPVEISVILGHDAEVRMLNREYRGQDKPTNVLSFAALDSENTPAHPEGESLSLGGIILAFETIAREAEEMNTPFRDHYTHLLVHGTLHLLGYDHEEDGEAETMESLEIRILAQLGIENPYESGNFVA